jgi:hypothetical protein
MFKIHTGLFIWERTRPRVQCCAPSRNTGGPSLPNGLANGMRLSLTGEGAGQHPRGRACLSRTTMRLHGGTLARVQCSARPCGTQEGTRTNCRLVEPGPFSDWRGASRNTRGRVCSSKQPSRTVRRSAPHVSLWKRLLRVIPRTARPVRVCDRCGHLGSSRPNRAADRRRVSGRSLGMSSSRTMDCAA